LFLRFLFYPTPVFPPSPAAPVCQRASAEPWSLTSLREKLIKIGAKVVSHGRYVTFQIAEVAVSRQCSDLQGCPVAHRPVAGATRSSMSGRSGVERRGPVIRRAAF
jgi:hypothetical protein